MRKISGVIVTFNNPAMLKDLLSDLLDQTRPPDEIIVVDNGAGDNAGKLIRGQFSEVRYIRLPENAGSAGGYHEGIKAAIQDSDLVWTLDDDVRLERDSLEELLKGLERLDSLRNIGSVRSVGRRRPDAVPYRLDLFPWRGTLIKSELIRRYGLPRKEFFIYGEDLEYAMRFNSKGLHCYWIPSSVCRERRMEGKNDYSLFGYITRIYALPFQLYYAFRNNLYVFMQYKDRRRLVRLLLYGCKATLLIALFPGPGRLEKIKAISRGLLDGFLGRLGKNEEYLP